VSTSIVDTWQTVYFRTKNLTKVPNGFLPLTQVSLIIQMKTQVLNLKTLKTQVQMRYLTLIFISTFILKLVINKINYSSVVFYYGWYVYYYI
jgi:hypothetical protein